MAYATTQDIRDRAPQIQITETSKPSEATVTEWLDDVHQTLDAALATIGYVTPVTGPASMLVLRDMVVQKMISLILRARIYGIGDVNQTGAKEADSFYEMRLAWLRDEQNPFVLPDAEVSGTGAIGAPGPKAFGFVPDEDYIDQSPRATIGQFRWLN